MEAIIVSCAPAFSAVASSEVESELGRVTHQTLAPGVLRFAVEDAGAAARAVAESSAVFVRHVLPATRRVALGATDDLDPIASAAAGALDAAGPSDARLGVQIRVLPGASSALSRQAVWSRIGALAAETRVLDARHPEDVLSILVAGEEAFIGLAPVAWHRSAWAGGERHFSRQADEVSRAGFKLLEALEVFGVSVTPGGRAVDLGAAPGGWTRVLADAGMVVDAVDPAALHPTVLAHPGVTHHRQRAEAWMASRSSGAGPSLLVNDMRMDADVAARLLVDMAAAMAPRGRLITTLKLPARGLVPAMTRALTTLGKGWRVDAVRHLFHNRTEVTVLGTVRAP